MYMLGTPNIDQNRLISRGRNGIADWPLRRNVDSQGTYR